MTTNADREPTPAGGALNPSWPADEPASPYEDLLMLATNRTRELVGRLAETAESQPLLLAGGAAVALGAALGLRLAARRPTPGQVRTPLAAARRVASSSWADPANYAELAELVTRLLRNPLVRETLINLALRQVKKRVGQVH
jgi:hypothetical protein